MKNKKIINEEIKRIHELMGIDSLINEILDDVFSLNLINESLLPTLIRSASKLDNLVRVADNIKASTIVDSAGNLLRAAEIPHATELSNLSNDADAFVKRLLEFADDAVGTPTRKVADEVINSFISEVHAQSTDLKNLQDTVNNVKNELTTNQGKTVDEANEEIQAAIDRTFYGDEAKVEFATPQLRDIYVHKLRKDLGLDTKWTRPAIEDVVQTTKMTPEEFNAKREIILKREIEDKFNDFIKIAEKLETNTKNTDEPFTIPSKLKNKRADDLKKEIESEVTETVNRILGNERAATPSAEKLEKWETALKDLGPAERELIIKKAVESAKINTRSQVEKILISLRSKFQLPFKKLESKLLSIIESTVIGEYTVKGYKALLGTWWKRVIGLIVIEIYNVYLEVVIRKNYDKELPLPTWFNGSIPIGESIWELTKWASGLLISKYTLLYNISVSILNTVLPVEFTGANYNERYKNNLAVMQSDGIVPEKSFNAEDENSTTTFINFLRKVLPESKKTLLNQIIDNNDGKVPQDILSNVGEFSNFWKNISQDDAWLDNMLGLPLNQIFVDGKNVYFVNENGRFTIQGLDTDNPTFKAKEGVDGEVETISIKNLFSSGDETINRFMVDFYPVDEQTKLVEKSTDYPKTITEQPGFTNPEVSSAVGLVSTTPTALSQQLATSNIPGLDMDNFVTYNFYNPSEVLENPSLPGYFKPKDGAKSITSALYYIDKKGQKDADGNYPVYRVNKTKDTETRFKPDTWYVRMPEGNVMWKELKDVIGTENITAPSSSAAKSPKQKWEEENPGVKLTQTGAIGELVTYSGSDGKRYKQENGQIVEF